MEYSFEMFQIERFDSKGCRETLMLSTFANEEMRFSMRTCTYISLDSFHHTLHDLTYLILSFELRPSRKHASTMNIFEGAEKGCPE